MIKNINLTNEIESLSLERSIDIDVVYSILEEAVLLACESRLNILDFDVKIRRFSNEFGVYVYYERIEDKPEYFISLRDPFRSFIKDYVSCSESSFSKRLLDLSFFNRAEINKSKSFLERKLFVAERYVLSKNLYFFVDKTIMGVVKKVTLDYLTVNIEPDIYGVLEREELLPNENYDVGDKIKVYTKHVIYDYYDQLLYFSRKCNELFLDLLRLEIPEINNGFINIKNIVRKPGYRSKVAVLSEVVVDPVSVCLGPSGLRVVNIAKGLNGEIVDFILWDKDQTKFILNSLKKNNVDSVELDYNKKIVNVFASRQNIAYIIGENGDNIKLLNRLLEWKVNVYLTV